jgi:hypothetical protein
MKETAMRPLIRTLAIAVLALLPTTAVLAQPAPDPSGHWEGTVQAPGMSVGFEIDLAKNGKGELEGTFGQSAQNLKGLSLSNLALEGNSIRFQIKGMAGDRTFEGSLDADGRSMSGDYTQSGFAMPFSLTRTGDPRIDAPIKNAPIGKEFEGTWNGTLDVNGTQLRLVLTMANQSGNATASILNVEEGLELPIAGITQKAASLTLEVKAVGGSYSGVLNAERTELAGTWTQGPMTLPMTFKLARP